MSQSRGCKEEVNHMRRSKLGRSMHQAGCWGFRGRRTRIYTLNNLRVSAGYVTSVGHLGPSVFLGEHQFLTLSLRRRGLVNSLEVPSPTKYKDLLVLGMNAEERLRDGLAGEWMICSLSFGARRRPGVGLPPIETQTRRASHGLSWSTQVGERRRRWV